jgi:hypothetical protein
VNNLQAKLVKVCVFWKSLERIQCIAFHVIVLFITTAVVSKIEKMFYIGTFLQRLKSCLMVELSKKEVGCCGHPQQ